MLSPWMWMAMAGPAQGGGEPGGAMGMLVPMVIMIAIFYFMALRPQQRKEKERQAMIAAVKKGDRILFSGGILGVVANVKEQTLVVKVGESAKVEILRGAVARVLTKDDKIEGEADGTAGN